MARNERPKVVRWTSSQMPSGDDEEDPHLRGHAGDVGIAEGEEGLRGSRSRTSRRR